MIYRSEHPKPQFRREHWKNLNGPWAFAFDHGNSGEERGMASVQADFPMTIQVPFCPESKLSGIGYTDFLSAVWYRRTVSITPEQLDGRVVLHFGAVDYCATVYVNGSKAGTHTGGYVSFSFDITALLTPGDNVITLRAQDDTRSRLIPQGKQSDNYASYGCYYTRTTGIWQTVWLEFTPKTYIAKVKYYPDAHNGTLSVHADLVGAGELTVRASFQGQPMGQTSLTCAGGHVIANVQLTRTHLWEVGKGGLYDLELTYGPDKVYSYFGLRSIHWADKKFYINGKSIFQRTVLDQGFYPEGIYTAASDAQLEKDIDLSMAMGFNGARLHQKVFEERFLYHCDRKGYLVWGEFPSWGLDLSHLDSVYGILPEWLEEIQRDFNHPALIGWCPLNETWQWRGRKQEDAVLELIYRATKAADPTRPCIDTSGGYHVVTDIYDLHDYTQDPAQFRAHYEKLEVDGSVDGPCSFPQWQKYDNRVPFFQSEYGGIRWSEDPQGWGYGNAPKTPEGFLSRLKGLTDALLDNPAIMGLCYTQLTDVEQEQNGLYTYDRRAKFDPSLIYPIFTRKAAIED